jgi:hypothetical protein
LRRQRLPKGRFVFWEDIFFVILWIIHFAMNDIVQREREREKKLLFVSSRLATPLTGWTCFPFQNRDRSWHLQPMRPI